MNRIKWQQIIIEDIAGKKIIYNIDERNLTNSTIEIDRDEDKNVVRIFCTLPQSLQPKRLIISTNIQSVGDQLFFANGFQSWSPSLLMGKEDKQEYLGSLIKKIAKYVAADHIFNLHMYSGYQMSWNYTYLQPVVSDGSVYFIGSLDEENAYTAYYYNHSTSQLIINRDVEGMRWQSGTRVLIGAFYIGDELLDNHYKTYIQDRLGIKRNEWTERPLNKKYKGWTSWYQYYDKIDAELCYKNINQLKNYTGSLDIFQLDDGFQTKTGDWYSINSKFPEGIKPIALACKEAGLKPGLWLAPLCAVSHSAIVKANPTYFIKDERGKPYKLAYNPVWKGYYYGLNVLLPEVENYLQGLFNTIIQDWGIEFLKLDFLFAGGAIPHSGFTRAQLMNKSLVLLRRLTQKAELLLCGVPVFPSIGLCDFCRIGNDIHLDWDFPLLKHLNLPERPSTLGSLQNTINRRQLNELAFGNDPDVFILREENQKMSWTERKTLFLINWLYSSLLFTSDDISTYQDQQKMIWQIFIDKDHPQVISHQEIDHLIHLRFMWKENEFIALINLTNKPIKNKDKNNNSMIEIAPHKSVITSATQFNSNSKAYNIIQTLLQSYAI